ncbi:Alpha/beta hydrolase fold-1 protein [Plesiocystis pacifica SIR-1]|uniref:Alpha/beta hydrolase fold-1 protein n=1 Tax=Plesiocystis pacifica SIR-1 TaxID=391625 RepID=A6G4G2_9BACT|nr:alpha/beta fold hydrolase [Plesiocystis pacifica]EDM79274.1 Alpha/beta hydrolase fold-1 protein [Plesiocystis pacifica SIR-1]
MAPTLERLEARERNEQAELGRVVRVRWELLGLEIDGASQAARQAAKLAVQRVIAASMAEQPLGSPAFRGTVVLIHGLAQNHRTWHSSARSLPAHLADHGYEVLNLDMRGHGLSRRLGAPPARRVDDYVDDLCRLVGALPRPPFVAGHSLGAVVGLRSAPRVELAGFVHWAGLYTFARDNPTLRAAARVGLVLDRGVPDSVAVNWRHAGKLIARLGPVSDAVNAVAPIQGWGRRSFEVPLLRERVSRGFDVTGWPVMSEMSRWALGEPIDDGSFAALEALPLLVFSGESDRLATPEDGLACYRASRSQDRRYVLFSAESHGFSAGHLDIVLGERAPRVVWSELLAWLDARSTQ